jgi:hypothetical protein
MTPWRWGLVAWTIGAFVILWSAGLGVLGILFVWLVGLAVLGGVRAALRP